MALFLDKLHTEQAFVAYDGTSLEHSADERQSRPESGVPEVHIE